MKKKIVLALIVALLLSGGYFGYSILNPKPITPLTPENGEASGEMATYPLYTREEIAQHNNQDSCWMAIEGDVYDLTPFVSSGLHPGGAVILEGCGTDATELFNNRPKSQTPHSNIARKMLPKYKIGLLGN